MGAVAYLLTYGRFPYSPPEQTSSAMKDAISRDHPSLAIATEPRRQASHAGLHWFFVCFRGAEERAESVKCSPELMDFIRSTLSRDADSRLSAETALQHSFILNPPKEARFGELVRLLSGFQPISTDFKTFWSGSSRGLACEGSGGRA